MKPDTEIRSFSLRADGEKPDALFVLRGCAVSYNSLSNDLGGFRETVAPGAFTRALAAKPDVRALFNHDQNVVLGRTSAGTLELRDTAQGLDFTCHLDPQNSQHRDLWHSVKRGDINSCSFAFRLEDGDDKFTDETEERTGRRFIQRRIQNVTHLYDVSVVTQPAYPTTSVVARSALEFGRNLFPQPLRSLRGRVCFEDQLDALRALEHAELRRKAQRLGAQLQRDEAFVQECEELRHQNADEAAAIREFQAAVFPWECRR